MAKKSGKSTRQQNYAKLRAAGYSREEARRLDKGSPKKTRERAETKKNRTRSENYHKMVVAGIPPALARERDRQSKSQVEEFIKNYKPNAKDFTIDLVVKLTDAKRKRLDRLTKKGRLTQVENTSAKKDLKFIRDTLIHVQEYGAKSISLDRYHQTNKLLKKWFPELTSFNELYGYPSTSEVA